MSIRILLADDHNLFRQGLRRILESQGEFEVVAEAASGLEAIDLAKQHQPDVAIMDIAMKELNGIEATVQLLRQTTKTAVLILSMYSDERYVIRAIPYQDLQQESEPLKAVHEARVKIVPRSERTIT